MEKIKEVIRWEYEAIEKHITLKEDRNESE